MANPTSIGFAAVISALREHGSANLLDAEGGADFLAAAFAKETDRGAVILATTAFEDKLTKRLTDEMCALNSREYAELFGFDAPLRSFSAKIRIAYALGILDKRLKRIAEVVRVMRNTCAHSGQSTSFWDASMMNAMAYVAQELNADLGDLLQRPKFLRYFFLLTINFLVVGIGKDEKSHLEYYASDLLDAYHKHVIGTEWPPKPRPEQSPPGDHGDESNS